MDKEEKCISLKLSKKIYELTQKKGIELESEYCWENMGTNFISTGFDESQWILTKTGIVIDLNEHYPALDTAELGIMLPESFRNEKQGRFDLEITKAGIDWLVGYRNNSGLMFKGQHIMCPKGLAEAMGKMYFYLLDNNLL